MLPWLDSGNPSSLYEEGRRAKAAIDEARERVSECLGCLFAELMFTSSGTEAVNTALIGAALANKNATRKRILIGAADHHSSLSTVPALAKLGYRVEFVPVDRQARIDLDAADAALGDDVLIVSVLHANNELGSIIDAAAVARLAHSSGALLHVDAVQTFRSLPWSIADIGADLVSISAHKIGGPKGIGGLYTRAGTPMMPLIYGGGQEREMRGGTENVAAIVGFGVACVLPTGSSPRSTRDNFEARLVSGGAISSICDAPRLDGHSHVRFPGIAAETMLILLDRLGISASSGAACSSGSIEPSHVLMACGYTEEEAKQGLRFTFGRGMNEDQSIHAADLILEAASRLR